MFCAKNVTGILGGLCLVVLVGACDASRPIDRCAVKDCDDGVACTVDECVKPEAECTHTPDDSLCAAAQVCDPVLGCQDPFVCTADADCVDDSYCNGAEVCSEGTCQSGMGVMCDDGVACTTDSCSDADQACRFEPDHDLCPAGELCDLNDGCQVSACVDGQDCDDGFYCNGVEICDGGTCAVGLGVSCDDSVACTVDSCDEGLDECVFVADDSLCAQDEYCDVASGACQARPCSADSDCSDGVFCNGVESCVAGACQPGQAPVCDDSIDCTSDSCDTLSDACAHLPDHSQCSAGQLCDPAQQGCVESTCENDMECDDGLFCNGVESCVAGICQAGALVVCDDGVSCTSDLCDEEQGSCQHRAQDALCDDGLMCNGLETCHEQDDCQAGQALDCSDLLPCTIDSCDEQAGCVHVADDTVCDDDLSCNGAETCDLVDGCLAGTPTNCSDGVECTVDSCDEQQGCQHQADDSLCSDGLWCSGVEVCDPSAGCLDGVPVDCADGIACTRDVCDESGACLNTADDLLCDDTNACTVDVCDLSSDPAGCVYTSIPNGGSCSDDNVCNGAEICFNGMCRSGNPLICADDNPCTSNYCLPAAGCMAEPEAQGTPCPNDTLCDGDEQCDGAGACESGVAPDCDDGQQCTTDFCSPMQGCLTVDNSHVCDDGDECTVHDRCQAGVCLGRSAEICGDGLDNDCDNEVDEGCAGDIGTWVAPYGLDSNPGTQLEPLASISAGIQNALIIGPPAVVYVAGDMNHIYPEDLSMAPGVSLLGGFSADGNWDYDPELYRPILISGTAVGLHFDNSTIDRDTFVDGFMIGGNSSSSPGMVGNALTVDGCAPTISNNWIFAGDVSQCRGVAIQNGADPLLSGNSIQADTCSQTAEVVRIENGHGQIVGNSIMGGSAINVIGVSLADAGTVAIEYNSIRGGDGSASGLSNNMASAMGIVSVGDFQGLQIVGNYIVGGSSSGREAISAGVYLQTCGDSVAQILSNEAVLGGPADAGLGNEGLSFGVWAQDSCPAEIHGNGYIAGSDTEAEVAQGVYCATNSACTLRYNGVIVGAIDSASVRAGGVACDTGSCAAIEFNQIIVGGTASEVTGLALGNNSSPTVDGNQIMAGWCEGMGITQSRGVGLFVAGSSSLVTNNIIWGGFCREATGVFVVHGMSSSGQPVGLNVNGNYINGAGQIDAFNGSSQGLVLASDGNVPPQGEYRNNIINAGYSDQRVSVAELGTGADPVALDYNDLIGGTAALYFDEGMSMLVSAAEVNGLSDMITGFNMSVYPDLVNEVPFGDFHLNGDALVDQGTLSGAADHDFDGEARPQGQGVDVGPDEAG